MNRQKYIPLSLMCDTHFFSPYIYPNVMGHIIQRNLFLPCFFSGLFLDLQAHTDIRLLKSCFHVQVYLLVINYFLANFEGVYYILVCTVHKITQYIMNIKQIEINRQRDSSFNQLQTSFSTGLLVNMLNTWNFPTVKLSVFSGTGF